MPDGRGSTPDIEAYQVQRVCGEVWVPALESVHYKAGTPPERRFVPRQ